MCSGQDLESSPADPLLASIEEHNREVNEEYDLNESEGDTSFPFGANR